VHYWDNKVFDIIDARCNHEIYCNIFRSVLKWLGQNLNLKIWLRL